MMDALGFLYGTAPGRMLLRPLASRSLSAACGRFLDTRASKALIPGFIRRSGIDVGEYDLSNIGCFNDFFCRPLKEGARPYDTDEQSAAAPCDGLLTVVPIRHDTVLAVKQSRWSVSRLLDDAALAAEFEGGWCLIFRLCVDNYHRYAWFASGTKSENRAIPGAFHTVRPVALEDVPVFTENTREYTVIESPSMGKVIQAEIGAMLVGKIVNLQPEAGQVRRGEEKGRFEYGGSTVLVLVQKDVLRLREDILAASREGRETGVKMGERIGALIPRSPAVTVLGGANLDIGGVAAGALIPGDSNPGRVRAGLGGVGRNIAHNMALLGLNVRLVTALGEDARAKEIENSCADLGIDLTGSVRVKGGVTSTYLFIADHSGEMALAVSDMDIYEHLTPEALAPLLPALNGSSALVLDTNLPAAAVRWLCANARVPVFADPVSTVKADKLLPVLDRIHTLKPNRMEAELLSGGKITDEVSLRRAADRLLAAGVKRVFITLGADGLLAAEGDKRLRLETRNRQTVNTTGCGDAFTAGLVWAFCRGLDLEGSARAGMAAASLAMESAETINQSINAKVLEERMRAWDGISGGSHGTEQIS